MYCFPNNKQNRFVSIDGGFYESVPNSFVVPLTRKRTLENISKSFIKLTIHICETILIASSANLKGDVIDTKMFLGSTFGSPIKWSHLVLPKKKFWVRPRPKFIFLRFWMQLNNSSDMAGKHFQQ